MSVTVMVEARVLRRRSEDLKSRAVELDLSSSPTLAEIIANIVREQYDDQRLIDFLTESDVAPRSSQTNGQRLSVQSAIDTALAAHSCGLFQVMFDGAPLEGGLREQITIREHSAMMFLRLAGSPNL